jgi:hypothetical protein
VISAIAVGARSRSERVQNLRKPRKRSTVTRRRDPRPAPLVPALSKGAAPIPEGIHRTTVAALLGKK